ncbi:Hpt domain-containing protein [Vibrio profundum]|uniref:Hpt domain-containing protein n=1 Tax=Vibrio profundum TaxID=2910247 RepID=UPI003D0B12CA
MGTKLKKLPWVYWLGVGWLLAVVVTAISYRSTQESIHSLETFSQSISELQGVIAFDSPFRIKHLNKLTSAVQNAYIQRIKLESERDNGFFLPDIGQLLYTTDRYIEHVQSFVKTEVDVSSLVNTITNARIKYRGQGNLESIYFQLGSSVLEALYSGNTGSPAVYRLLDKVFLQSQTLPSEQAKELQQILGQISNVLGNYAQGNYLVEKLLNHDIYPRITSLEAQYHVHQEIYLSLITVLSGLCLLVMMFSQTQQARHITVSEVSTSVVDEGKEDDLGEETQTPATRTEAPSKVPSINEAPISAPNNSKQNAFMPDFGQESATEPSPPEKVENSAALQNNQPPINFQKMMDALNDDTESVILLLNVFIQDHHNDAQQLAELMGKDAEKVLRKAHSLKGVAASLGAEALQESAGEVEKALKHNETVSNDMLERLSTDLDTAIDEANRYILEKQS